MSIVVAIIKRGDMLSLVSSATERGDEPGETTMTTTTCNDTILECEGAHLVTVADGELHHVDNVYGLRDPILGCCESAPTIVDCDILDDAWGSPLVCGVLAR